MVRLNEIRAGESVVDIALPTDAAIVFIGRIYAPWTDRLTCPRQGREDGPTCRIEVFEPWVAALDGITEYERLEVLYWLHESRRDLVRQSPRNDGMARGTFSLRTPARPNPIGTQVVKLLRVEGASVFVRTFTVWTARRSSISNLTVAPSHHSLLVSPETIKLETQMGIP
jgi:tRNA (adenine37-N6)-methyltransferase